MITENRTTGTSGSESAMVAELRDENTVLRREVVTLNRALITIKDLIRDALNLLESPK